MAYCDAKSKTSRTRSNQKECKPSPHRRRARRTRRDSQTVSGESLSLTGDGWEETDRSIPPGIPAGGIVAQLIEETIQEIEENRKYGDRLQARLLTLYGLKSSLDKE